MIQSQYETRYNALLRTLEDECLPAFILSQKGFVLAVNNQCERVRTTPTRTCWHDYCLNQPDFESKALPHKGQSIAYLNTAREVQVGTLLMTKLDAGGHHIFAFIIPIQHDQDEPLGFMIFEAQKQLCFWSDQASELHDESPRYGTKQNLQQFLSWYEPCQRDRLLYAMLQCEKTHVPQQVTLKIAHSKQKIRYLWLTLPIQDKPLTCAFIRAVKRPITTNRTKNIPVEIEKSGY
ncbi:MULTISPECIES: hypothetical protein [Gammaproteobacteria]|uniref:hypothetical protein n=1 Tax=Gammaproteobacteria TaxID=1236 RepID=UPI000DD0D604|nr:MULTISPECIES: hypothetical protein [Gammaproteobacteria]RTE87529.1 hypothetical protein DQX04_03895 [Aliidiomarina sp. B3213]TCZ92686.1 hypothetical protein EYQ95_01410 [Lysobacter sp. N42]